MWAAQRGKVDVVRLLLKEGKAEARKAIKKVFEERYHQQSSAKKEKKAAGTMYFYKKMAF